MSQTPEEPAQLELAELQRGGIYRDAAERHRRRGLAIDLLTISILVALLLVGVLAVFSGQSAGEQGLGVAMICGAVLLLSIEVVYSFHLRSAPRTPPGVAKNGENDD